MNKYSHLIGTLVIAVIAEILSITYTRNSPGIILAYALYIIIANFIFNAFYISRVNSGEIKEIPRAVLAFANLYYLISCTIFLVVIRLIASFIFSIPPMPNPEYYKTLDIKYLILGAPTNNIIYEFLFIVPPLIASFLFAKYFVKDRSGREKDRGHFSFDIDLGGERSPAVNMGIATIMAVVVFVFLALGHAVDYYIAPPTPKEGITFSSVWNVILHGSPVTWEMAKKDKSYQYMIEDMERKKKNSAVDLVLIPVLLGITIFAVLHFADNPRYLAKITLFIFSIFALLSGRDNEDNKRR